MIVNGRNITTAVFDFDGTLAMHLDKGDIEKKHLRLFYDAAQHSPDTFYDRVIPCEAPKETIDFVKKLASDGVRLVCLSGMRCSLNLAAKQAFLKKHYDGNFEFISVCSQEFKVDVLQFICEHPDQTLYVDDVEDNLSRAARYGFVCYTPDLKEYTKPSAMSYTYNYATNVLTVYSNRGVHDYCCDHNINIRDFNGKVVIADGVVDISGLLASAQSFNETVIIPNGVKCCTNLFVGCENFNQPLEIPGSVTDATQMLMGCSRFNSSVKLHEGLELANFMFDGCASYNKPIILPGTLKECGHMFNSCVALEHSVAIPDGVLYCSMMFGSCFKMPEHPAIPSSVIDSEDIFLGW